MVLFRAAAYILLIAGFILLVLDGMRSLAADSLLFTPLGQVWFNVNPSSLSAFQQWVGQDGIKAFLQPISDMALFSPGWLLPLAFSFLLAWIGRKRPQTRRWIGDVE